ncbi:MAG: TetR/AcrR family transcriptional regulator [Bacteroidales bacterium]|nr:TetR/AcrR family transcriptional regulator [Bacteroidales bacterium]
MSRELKHIVEKTHALYLKCGIKSVTMDDVATHLGISKKTLYKYVTDKDDLVSKVVDMQIDAFKDQITCEKDPSRNAIEELLRISKIVNKRLKSMNPITFHDLKRYYPAHFKRFAEIRYEKLYKNIAQNVRQGKLEGIYRQDLDENIIAKLHLSRIENTIDNDFFSIEEFTSNAFFQEIFIYHIRGIANEKGIEFLENKLQNFDIEDLNSL